MAAKDRQGLFQIDIATDELEHAAWFTRSEVAEAIKQIDADPMLKWLHLSGKSGESRDNRESFKQKLRYVPPRGAIAYRLIKRWVEGKL